MLINKYNNITIVHYLLFGIREGYYKETHLVLVILFLGAFLRQLLIPCFQLVVWFELVPQVFTLVVFHLVRVLSDPPRIACWRRRVDLSSRYQTEECLKICHHLLPVFYTHLVIFSLTAFGITLFPLIFPRGDEANFAVFLETMAWTPLYACAMPIIVYLREQYRYFYHYSKQIKLQRKKAFPQNTDRGTKLLSTHHRAG